MTDHNSTLFETYRAYNQKDVLLYVGKSANAITRMVGHAYNSEWYSDVARIEIDRHQTYEEASEHEKKLIKDLQPVWNIAYVDDKDAKKNARRMKNHRARKNAKGEQVLANTSNSADYVQSDGFQGSYGAVFLLMLGTAKYGGRVPLTKEQIGEKLGYSRQTVSRALNHLKKNEMVITGDHEGREYYFLPSPAAQKGMSELVGTKEAARSAGLSVIQGGKT